MGSCVGRSSKVHNVHGAESDYQPTIGPKFDSSELVTRLRSNSPDGAQSMQTRRALWSQYTHLGVVASGGYGSVIKARHVDSGLLFAMKMLPVASTLRNRRMVENEIRCLREATRSPYVVRFDGAYETERHTYIITEWCEHGDLLSYIQNHGPFKERSVQKSVAFQLAAAMYHMHSQGIVHRDMKPENVLVSLANDIEDLDMDDPPSVSFKGAGGHSCRLKVCDFGFASFLNHDTYHSVGTSLYEAPEVLAGQLATSASDMFAIGIILYISIGGYHPFNENAQLDPDAVARRKRNGAWSFNDTLWKQVPRCCKNAITGLLAVDPRDRWTAKNLLECDWLADAQEVERSVSRSVYSRVKRAPVATSTRSATSATTPHSRSSQRYARGRGSFHTPGSTLRSHFEHSASRGRIHVENSVSRRSR